MQYLSWAVYLRGRPARDGTPHGQPDKFPILLGGGGNGLFFGGRQRGPRRDFDHDGPFLEGPPPTADDLTADHQRRVERAPRAGGPPAPPRLVKRGEADQELVIGR